MRTLRLLLVSFLLAVTLLAPAGNFAFAEWYPDTLGVGANNNRYPIPDPILLVDTSWNGDDSAKLTFKIDTSQLKSGQKPSDDGDGIVEWNELGPLENFSDANLENSNDHGVFLVVGTGPTVPYMVTTGLNGQQVVDQYIPQKIDNSSTTSYSIKVSGNPTSEHKGTGWNVGETGTNIGYYIYKINPQGYFDVTQKSTYTGTIPVVGLAPSTTYHARLFINSNEGYLNPFTLYGNIVTFTTKPQGQTTDHSSDILNDITFSSQTGSAVADDAINDFTDGSCSISLYRNVTPFVKGFNLKECIIVIFYNIFYKASAWLLEITGRLLDAFINISIHSTIYRSTFVAEGWRIVRDLSNIFFIFILLYIAIGTILGSHGFNPKKLIAKVVIIGLLINFSLYFTRVIVDAGNIFARLFYDQIGEVQITTPGGHTYNVHSISAGSEEHSISSSVVAGLNVQKVLSSDNFGLTKNIGLNPGTLFAVIFVGFVINISAAWLFFQSAAFFLGRIGVLWFSMVFAPLAFVSSIVPGIDRKMKQLGWHAWISSLISASFNATIFLFFIYLIVALTIDPIFKSIIADDSSFSSFIEYLAAMSIPIMIILGLMKAAKDIAKEMGGQFGEAFAGALNTAVGVAGTVLVGGAALGASGAASWAGQRLGQSQTLANWAVGKNRDGSTNMRFGGGAWEQKIFKAIGKTGIVNSAKVQRASFDARNTGVANLLTKATGINLNAGAKIPGMAALGVENTVLGAKGREEKQQAKFQKSLADLGLDQHKFDEETDKLNDRKDYAQMIDELADQTQTEATRIFNTKGRGSNENKEAQNNLAAIKRFQDVVKNGGVLDVDAKLLGDSETIINRVKAMDKTGKLMQDPTKAGEKGKSASGATIDLEKVEEAGLDFTSKRFVEAYKAKDGKVYDSTGKLRTDLRLDPRTNRYAEWNAYAKGKKAADREGYDVDGFAVKKYSISTNEAAVENIKTARQKDYVRMLQRDSGLQMRKSIYDAMGNIKVLGRVQGRELKQGAREFGRAMTRALKAGVKGALVGGAASLIAGPVALPLLSALGIGGVSSGALIGASAAFGGGIDLAKEIARGVSKGTAPDKPHHLGKWAKYFAGRDIEAHKYAHMDPGAKHEHGDHAHPIYKTPAGDFLSKLFEGVGKGGGGHDAHGGGGGDHGGGHH
jgi:hypothetical protein